MRAAQLVSQSLQPSHGWGMLTFIHPWMGQMLFPASCMAAHGCCTTPQSSDFISKQIPDLFQSFVSNLPARKEVVKYKLILDFHSWHSSSPAISAWKNQTNKEQQQFLADESERAIFIYLYIKTPFKKPVFLMLYYSCSQSRRSPDYNNKWHHEHAILSAMPRKTLPDLLSLVNKVGF